MKSNELRIGNLVMSNFKRKNEVVDIKTIDFTEDWFNLFQPIPLTEEWLLKFGFENKNEFLELQINDDISIIWVGYLSIMINGAIGFMSENDLIHTHQLQNLYFALTGEELTLNNK